MADSGRECNGLWLLKNFNFPTDGYLSDSRNHNILWFSEFRFCRAFDKGPVGDGLDRDSLFEEPLE